jgi:hypothetical protein
MIRWLSDAAFFKQHHPTLFIITGLRDLATKSHT